ncbi:MAG: hypothetical protein JO347_06260, partial [Candidatus Eremiobacteraeota bacterium]|nr:hypothetical protein [Candidatus Eremiobacteraeota bacterium]
MKHGTEFRVRLPITGIITAGVLGAAMFVAACGNQNSLPGQTPSQLAPQYKNCNGGTQSVGIRPAAAPMPVIGQCPSPPPQWDIIVDNPGNNTATSYQFTTSGNATPLATMGPS